MKKIKLECLECKQEVTSNTIKMHTKNKISNRNRW